MTAIEPTMTREEARERTTTIRGKLSDALDELVSAYFDGVHTALGYDDWDTYVHEEFGEVRFKLAAADRGERVRELRGKGMPVKVTAGLFGVTERTVKRDTTGGQMSPERVDAQTATESIRSAVGHLKGHREDLTSAIRQHPDEERVRRAEATYERLRNEGIIPPPPTDEELRQSVYDLIGNKPREPHRLTPEDKFAKALNAVGAAIRINHGVNEALLDDDGWAALQALGLRWSDDEGHYIIVGMEDLD